MAGLSPLTVKHLELVEAYDTGVRLFNRLRDLNMSDEERKQAMAEYKAAAIRYEKLRLEAVK